VSTSLAMRRLSFIAEDCSSRKSSSYDANTSSAGASATVTAVKDKGKQNLNGSSVTATSATEMGLKLSAAILYSSDLL
jgi:hypothetical protein